MKNGYPENRREHFRSVKVFYGVLVVLTALIGIFSIVSAVRSGPERVPLAVVEGIAAVVISVLLILNCRRICSYVVDVSFYGDECRVETGLAYHRIKCADVFEVRTVKGLIFRNRVKRILIRARTSDGEITFRVHKVNGSVALVRSTVFLSQIRFYFKKESDDRIIDMDPLKEHFTRAVFRETVFV